MARRLLLAVGLVLAVLMPAPGSAAVAGRPWSIMSVPGWEQDRYPVRAIDWRAVSHVFHFAMYPTSSGALRIGDIQSEANANEAVRDAHAAGREIVLVVGGEGEGRKFVEATNAANRPRFIREVVGRVNRHGYDGVSVDWEESVRGAQPTALVRGLRAALPRKLVTIDVVSGLVSPSIVARLHPSVDTVNLMSYRSNGLDEVAAYRRAGVPVSKMIMGIGFSRDYRDGAPAQVQEKVGIVKRLGMRGTEVWQVGDLRRGWRDPRLVPLRRR